MAIYVGINGVPKEVSEVYVGVNGAPKEVSDIYSGDSGGEPAAVYSGVKPGETVFTTSGVFTVPKGVKSIDVFCVGGGGGCGVIGNAVYSGAGGGYTKTVSDIEVEEGQEITITVGSGSNGQGTGGASSIGSFCSANGGYGGSSSAGGNGGSGGGGAPVYYSAYTYSGTDINTAMAYAVGIGGYNGGDGTKDYVGTWVVTTIGINGLPYSSFYMDYSSGYIHYGGNGGKGQGTTTRYFGESDGTLYAGGGNGTINIFVYKYAMGQNGSYPYYYYEYYGRYSGVYAKYQPNVGSAYGSGGVAVSNTYWDTTIVASTGLINGFTIKYDTSVVAKKAADGTCIIRWDPKNFKKS
jgi:hypothetical protein